jgi:hypothetical protein
MATNLREFTVELRHDARNDDVPDRLGRNLGTPKERRERDPELVARASQRGRDAPSLAQLEFSWLAREKPELRLGIANVDP